MDDFIQKKFLVSGKDTGNDGLAEKKK